MLFPDHVEQPHLSGLARLASEGVVLAAKRRVEYRELPTRRFIGRASGRKMPFDWTINPYRGCEFGCKYCYARFTHEFLELRETEQFETEIYAKQFNEALFRKELAQTPVREGICLGTATDPYQPAERRFEVTRRILSAFAQEQGRVLSITTKSDLIARDVDLLVPIAQKNVLYVFLTITTTNEKLARKLEPYAPRPALRLAALAKLAGAGIRVVVLASPVMPLINDSYANLSKLAEAVAKNGAIYLMGGVLFLKPCAQKAFFPFLEAEFPHLLRRYRERYQHGAFLNGSYPETISQRMQQIREAYGLTQKPDNYQPEQWTGDPQLTLFGP